MPQPASYVALLRAVNVGGTGKLPMSELRALCEAAGLQDVRTYLASGNVVFRTGADGSQVKSALEAGLLAYAGRPAGVILRTAAEMNGVVAANPFPQAPPNRVVAIFLDKLTGPSTLTGISRQAADERVQLGRQEIYVHLSSGIGRSRFFIPAAADCTARNMNTVAALAA